MVINGRCIFFWFTDGGFRHRDSSRDCPWRPTKSRECFSTFRTPWQHWSPLNIANLDRPVVFPVLGHLHTVVDTHSSHLWHFPSRRGRWKQTCKKNAPRSAIQHDNGHFSPYFTMYGIFTNMCPKNHLNVGKYTIHGVYGHVYWWFFPLEPSQGLSLKPPFFPCI